MASTHLSLHYHLIFATKNRELWLAATWRSRFHEYLGGVVQGLGASPLGGGGMADHVHLLVTLKATHCLADFMRELKKTSSIWLQQEMKLPGFHWQEGYATFTVSASACSAMKEYIAQQEKHHRTKSCREELMDLLRKSGVAFEEKYFD